MSVKSQKLTAAEYGEPTNVVQLLYEKHTITDDFHLLENQVMVRMKAAAINPADLNTIQGKYPVKLNYPSALGNEGYGLITAIGPKVKNFKLGDAVIPRKNEFGTWRTHAVCSDDDLIKISNGLSPAMAATISINPCTALRLLTDFVDLKEGDSVLQNGGNSGVGRAVIQLCRHLRVHAVCTVRNREDIKELKNELMELGAAEVLTEEELRTTDVFKTRLPPPALALNCVGGKSATEQLRHLKFRGTMVTYGGMSQSPIILPTANLIFNDPRVRGFWLTRWRKEHDDQEVGAMFEEICSLALKGILQPPPHTFVPLADYKTALKNAITSFIGKKQILLLDDV